MAKITVKTWLLLTVTFFTLVESREIRAVEDVSDAIRSLQEQVNALLVHRQQDYNALEGSLKRAIEKNTELFVLKNEIKQLRKEVTSLRGGNGNEAKNERLRVRWLGSAVTELQGEVAEVLRTRNASEELAERSRMKGEFTLLKGDVAAVGKGIRNLGGRITKIEAVLGTIRVDITAVKERFSTLSRTCADIASQLSSVQIELKSMRCDSPLSAAGNLVNRRDEGGGGSTVKLDSTPSPDTVDKEEGDRRDLLATDHGLSRRRFTRRHEYAGRHEGYRMRLEDRLKNLERKISLSVQKRVSLEKRIAAYGQHEWTSLSKRIKSLEKTRFELSREISNVSQVAAMWTKTVGDSLSSRLIVSLGALEDAIGTNTSLIKGELVRLGVNAARKAAELSLTREELNSLRRTVQALSVSASKLQERSDGQQVAINRLNGNSSSTSHLSSPRADALASLEQLEDRYHLIRYNLTGDCWQSVTNEPSDGLRLLDVGKDGSPVLVFCRKGWTVVARRIDGTLDFDRSWDDYSLGFGTPVGEYWIGNEVLHRLTRDNCSQLRIDMRDIYGERWRAEYELFAIESEETGYRLRVHGFTGNATDALSYQNGMAFSAKDRDMDASSTHCARNYHGGWWFSRCQHANLNGKYSLGLSWFRSDTNQWMSIATSEMSVRPSFDCQSR